MITQNSFTTDWINQVSKRYKADKILVEKSIRDWLFTDYEYTKLNKLKKSNPEAFFYLYLALHR
jgi:hypothetical protein